ncbi:hypothetical protein [Halobaculum halobium]|uniref:hypothetical protein n=1 Tax=Halobaculum halobium TaxID=3032281 RepID=UPI0036F29C6A
MGHPLGDVIEDRGETAVDGNLLDTVCDPAHEFIEGLGAIRDDAFEHPFKVAIRNGGAARRSCI